MVYDDIIVGSGLSGLAVALGLPANRRVVVVAGRSGAQLQRYSVNSPTPCASSAPYGLGSYWHGVIPVRTIKALPDAEQRAYVKLFRVFYPNETLISQLGSSQYFVPFRPIRPARWWKELQETRPGLSFREGLVERIHRAVGVWQTELDDKARLAGKRLWLAAGALASSRLIASSGLTATPPHRFASDHFNIYLGQIAREDLPVAELAHPQRSRSGSWFTYLYDARAEGLLTFKPAWFDARRLDSNIERRSAFGLSTSQAIWKIAGGLSAGLIAESIFNRFGVALLSSVWNVYAQFRVADSYLTQEGEHGLAAREDVIQADIQKFRGQLDLPHLRPTRKPKLYFRGIHLHNTLNQEFVDSELPLLTRDGLTIVDPSAIRNIGSEHHSFKAMASAYYLAGSTH